MYADNKDDVNDLYQESVFNIWKSYQSFRGESSFTTWVYRISLNTCISDFRKKKKHDYVPLEQQVDIMEDCERNELLKEMYSLIKRLNKVDRMFILLWLDEKSYDEIAEITGTSRNNVAIKLHRIKEKLKNMSNL
jgi:RNA polymerase sigma-70 factor (ECF subfamily)